LFQNWTFPKNFIHQIEVSERSVVEEAKRRGQLLWFD
jgi:hypothetical protein